MHDVRMASCVCNHPTRSAFGAPMSGLQLKVEMLEKQWGIQICFCGCHGNPLCQCRCKFLPLLALEAVRRLSSRVLSVQGILTQRGKQKSTSSILRERFLKAEKKFSELCADNHFIGTSVSEPHTCGENGKLSV